MAALIAYIVFVYCTVAATGGHTPGPTCYQCHDVAEPADCTSLHQCPSDQVCSTELHAHYIKPFWKFNCKKEQDCREFSHHFTDFGIFGKKKRGERDYFACSHCCKDTVCQKAACTLNEFFGIPTAPPPTVVAATKLVTNTTTQSPNTTQTPSTSTSTSTTTPSTTTAPWPCLNFETTSGQCAQLQADGHCKPSADTKYEVAKLRCRSTCKFC